MQKINFFYIHYFAFDFKNSRGGFIPRPPTKVLLITSHGHDMIDKMIGCCCCNDATLLMSRRAPNKGAMPIANTE